MIDVLNRKIQNCKVDNMTAIHIDKNISDTLTDNFDVIYTSMALHHIKDTEATIKKLYKLLNKDGYLCIVELVEDDGSFHANEKDFEGHNGFNVNRLQILLEKAGYKGVSSSVFYTDSKDIDNLKVDYALFIMIARK